MFDRSFLPDSDLEFTVIADTHYMLDPGDSPIEFESRRHQTRRSKATLEMLHSLGTDINIHLGDLTQEYPESPNFLRALAKAQEQISNTGVQFRHCVGNHDIGDKLDPTMPTHPVTSESLAAYEDRFGSTFYSFDAGTHHFVVINSQILNTDLPINNGQMDWLARDLESSSGQRTCLFLHLPLYLFKKSDPAFGNYDVIAEPARGELIALIEKHGIELVCAAHVHFSFFDRIGGADYHILPSPAFTRPGFSHLFTSAPPPEHGRDDTPKLAFYLYRSGSGYLDRHIVRTSGRSRKPSGRRVITRTARSLPEARLGITLTHPPAPVVQIPLAYPSTIRQTVRNDYPILACQEMGLRHIRVPIEDIEDDNQNPRLQILRESGALLTAICVSRDPATIGRRVRDIEDQIDSVEMQVPKTQKMKAKIDTSLEVSVAPIDPTEPVAGKQHLRTRLGFPVSRANAAHPFHRSVVSIAHWESPNLIQTIAKSPPDKPVDLTLSMVDDDKENLDRVIRAALLTACIDEARLFCEPSLDLDRTMDVAKGFLDPLCNPRPIVTAYRLLNTILFANLQGWTLTCMHPLTIVSPAHELSLSSKAADGARFFDLVEGTSHESASEVAGNPVLREISSR